MSTGRGESANMLNGFDQEIYLSEDAVKSLDEEAVVLIDDNKWESLIPPFSDNQGLSTSSCLMSEIPNDILIKCSRFECSSRNLDTIAIHAGFCPSAESPGSASHPPLFRNNSYMFRDSAHAIGLFGLEERGMVYTRFGNPTQDVLEQRLALLEGAPALGALVVASGMNALFYSIINLSQSGDHIVASKNIFGGTYTMLTKILPREFGINVTVVDMNDNATVERAIQKNTRALFGEVCSNPGMIVMDIEAIANIAHRNGLPLVVDATFTTPYLCRPLEFGADVVVHSVTKWLGGHGCGVGGVIIDGGRFNWGGGRHPLYDNPSTDWRGIRWGHDLSPEMQSLAYIQRMRTTALRNLGGCISPDNCWMFLQGLETLTLRMEKHVSNSLKIAKWLQAQSWISWVRYPGLSSDPMHTLARKYMKGTGGGIIIFELKGGISAGKRLVESCKLLHHRVSLGDTRSLVVHPASTTHSQMTPEARARSGISPGMIRLSVGIENPEDIIKDIESAVTGL